MSVKYSVSSLFMITFLAVFICTTQLEALEDLEFSTDLSLYSKYIWRGFKLDNDPVFQSGLYISGYGFNFSIWGSADFKSDDSLNSDEMDYSLSYIYNLEDIFNMPIYISAGYTYYDFPPGDTNSQELFLGLNLDNLFSPSLTWYHDFEDESQGGGKGDYIVVEISRSIEIDNSPITVDLSGHAGYNSELFINGSGGDIGCEIGLIFNLSDNCSISPSVGYSIPFGDLSDSNDGNQDNEFYSGIVLSINL
jgi:hypothetical protein